MLKKLFPIVIVLVFVGGAFVWWSAQPALRGDSPSAPAETTPVLGLVLKDYNGRSVSLRSFLGKPFVVNSWAAWCPFCKEELPTFAAVQQEFGNRVQIIAINRGESLEISKKFTDERGISDSLIFLLDPSDTFYSAIGGFSMPETIFVDAIGRITEHKRGPLTREEFRERVNKLINQNP